MGRTAQHDVCQHSRADGSHPMLLQCSADKELREGPAVISVADTTVLLRATDRCLITELRPICCQHEDYFRFDVSRIRWQLRHNRRPEYLSRCTPIITSMRRAIQPVSVEEALHHFCLLRSGRCDTRWLSARL